MPFDNVSRNFSKIEEWAESFESKLIELQVNSSFIGENIKSFQPFENRLLETAEYTKSQLESLSDKLDKISPFSFIGENNNPVHSYFQASVDICKKNQDVLEKIYGQQENHNEIIKILNDRINKLEHQLSAKNSQVEILNSKLAKLREEKGELELTLDDYEQKSISFDKESKMNCLSSYNVNVHSNEAQNQNAIIDDNVSLDILDHKASENKEHIQNQGDLLKTEQNRKILMQETNKVRAELSQARTAMMNLKNEKDACIDGLKNNISSYKQEIQTSIKENKCLKRELLNLTRSKTRSKCGKNANENGFMQAKGVQKESKSSVLRSSKQQIKSILLLSNTSDTRANKNAGTKDIFDIPSSPSKGLSKPYTRSSKRKLVDETDSKKRKL